MIAADIRGSAVIVSGDERVSCHSVREAWEMDEIY